MIAVDGQQTVSATIPHGGGTARTATPVAGRKDFRFGLSPMSPDLAFGGRLQPCTSFCNHRSALHQRPRMGQAFPERGIASSAGPTAAGPTPTLRSKDRNTGDRGGHLAPPGSGFALHHLVADQAGTLSACPRRGAEPRDHPAHSSSPWAAFSDRSKLVPEYRPGLRSKKTP